MKATLNGVLAEKLFSVLPFFDFNSFYKEYTDYLAKHNIRHSNFRYLCWCIHKRRDFDLDTNIILIGSARYGKSTDLYDMVDTIYGYRGKRITDEFTDKHIVWNAKQGFTAFGDINQDIIASDEAYFMTDRRQSMDFLQIKYLQLLNALASRKNIVFTLMQDFTDLDTRILKKCDILGLIYERGSKLIFAKSHSFPIIKQNILDTANFEKKPYLLENKERAIYELHKKPSFINECEFYDFQKVNPEIWSHYWQIKQKEQNEAIDKATRTFERINRQPAQSTEPSLQDMGFG